MSVRRYDTIALGLLKKEEERREECQIAIYIFTSRGALSKGGVSPGSAVPPDS